jgi:hypothetical protein
MGQIGKKWDDSHRQTNISNAIIMEKNQVVEETSNNEEVYD